MGIERLWLRGGRWGLEVGCRSNKMGAERWEIRAESRWELKIFQSFLWPHKPGVLMERHWDLPPLSSHLSSAAARSHKRHICVKV